MTLFSLLPRCQQQLPDHSRYAGQPEQTSNPEVPSNEHGSRSVPAAFSFHAGDTD